MARNPSVSAVFKETFEQIHEQIEAGQREAPYRQFVEFGYRTEKSWSRFRRMVGKAEVLENGDNPRFIVSNLPGEGFPDQQEQGRFSPACLYEQFYCARGDMENRIKEQSRGNRDSPTAPAPIGRPPISCVYGFRPSLI